MARAPRLAALAVAGCCALAAGSGFAQEPPAPPTPEQLAAQERVRPVVMAIWQEVRTPPKSDDAQPRFFWDITDRLIAIGPDAVPFLASEIELSDPQTFHLCAYALGRLGGADAEAALRKAIRAADARGGRFGIACKRYALFGLALLGKPDALELAQTGPVSMHGVQMVPDLPLFAHMTLLIGRGAAPVLARQFDTYVADPKETDRLEDTLIALGRAGDPAIVPKMLPLLSHTSPKIRAIAADAIARLGEPALCDRLMPLLGATEEGEKIIVGAAIERWKPSPCYKAMVGRLEVETDMQVRAYLYSAIVPMAGEAALPVLRNFVKSPNQFDQALVVDAVGRVRSTKGLNMLRALLPDANGNTIAHALQAIAAIGGEGATDTLLATASDRRRFVANSAAEILTNLGDKRIAPRRASDLLALVREPVGNLSLRSPIVQLSEALVALEYTDPIDDLKAALAVQSDLEIIDTLTSCVRRLEALAKHGNDAAAWTAELGSSFKDVRLLAGRRLAELGTAPAVRSLGTALARTDLPAEERANILLSIAQSRTAAAADLVERNLAEPVYDAWELRDARAAAAYAARRLGGDRMTKALRASALRRDGRDWATLAYLAVVEKSAAIDLLTTLRVHRLRYPEGRTGTEELLLEAALSDLAAGRAPDKLDVPPDALLEP